MKRSPSPLLEEDESLKRLRLLLDTATEDSSGVACVNMDNQANVEAGFKHELPTENCSLVFTSTGIFTTEEWFSTHVYSCKTQSAARFPVEASKLEKLKISS